MHTSRVDMTFYAYFRSIYNPSYILLGKIWAENILGVDMTLHQIVTRINKNLRSEVKT